MGTFKKSYLTLLVLSLLREEMMYGYQICQVVKQRTSGRYELKEGVLYPLLHGLEKSGLIRADWRPRPEGGPDRCYFKLTEYGRKVLGEEREAFDYLVALLPGYQHG